MYVQLQCENVKLQQQRQQMAFRGTETKIYHCYLPLLNTPDPSYPKQKQIRARAYLLRRQIRYCVCICVCVCLYHISCSTGCNLKYLMPFISKDWRSPGETWVKTQEGWEKKKVLENCKIK